MKNKISVILLTALVLSLLVPLFAVNTFAVSSGERYGRRALEKMANSPGLVFAYDKLSKGVVDMRSDIVVSEGTNTVSADEMRIVFDAYYYDYPEHFWVENSFSMKVFQGVVQSVMPKYSFSPSDLPAARVEYEKTVNNIIFIANKASNKYEMEKIVHDTLARTVSLADGTTSHPSSAYGAIIEGMADSQGYARAFQAILSRLGISAMTVHSKDDAPHFWNVVDIDGTFYHVDVCLDDADDFTYYAFFNVTTDIMSEAYGIASMVYSVPECTSYKANYFMQNGGLFSVYSAESIGHLLASSGKTMRLFLVGDTTGFRDWVYHNIGDIAVAAGITSSFKYSVSHLGHEYVFNFFFSECGHVYDDECDTMCNLCEEKREAPHVVTFACDKVCKKCGATIENASHEFEWIVDFEPTLTSVGMKHERCVYCGLTQSDGTIIPVIAHVHDLEFFPAVVPTCAHEGNLNYWKCTDCGKKFASLDAVHELTSVILSTDMGNHVGGTSLVGAEAPTMQNDGYSGDTYCLGCGTQLSVGSIVPKLDHVHQMTRIPESKATCVFVGNVEYWQCSVCNNKYGDSLGIKLLESTIAPRDFSNHYGESRIQNVKEPTCDTPGYTGDSYCSGCGQIVSAGKTVETLPHTFTLHSENDPTCIRDGNVAYLSCSVCKKNYSAEDEKTLIENIVVDIDPSCHGTNTEIRNAVAATVFESGYTGDLYCLDCGGLVKEGSVAPRLDHEHEMKFHESVPATCVNEGNYEYWSCEVCKKMFFDEDGIVEITSVASEINSTNHAGDIEYRGKLAPTTESEGYSGDKYCMDCGKLIERGSILDVIIPIPKATARVSGDTVSVEFDIPAINILKVRVDGIVLNSSLYTIGKDNYSVTLTKEYAETLDNGTHTITVVLNIGECEAEFELVERGFFEQYKILIILAVAAVLVLFSVFIIVKGTRASLGVRRR